MSRDLILAIDQGTTSTRAMAFDLDLRVVASAAQPLVTDHPAPGWAEQDAEAILASVIDTVGTVVDAVGGPGRIAAVGLDNQGETVVAWDAASGRALAPAVLWHCRRSQPIVERLRADGHEADILRRTGLPLDPYFSAAKLTWLLEHERGVQAAARTGTLRWGTVDAWITARLDGGRARTDVSTASRTQLLSITDLRWDPELLDRFGIDHDTLPDVVPSAGDLGSIGNPTWGGTLPLRAMACDQQAALAGHAAFTPGAIKATFGTGAFLLANAGPSFTVGPEVETSVGWALPGGLVTYVYQGGVYTAGAFIDWLRDIGVVGDAAGLDGVTASVSDTAGVRVLPALAGIGSPRWLPSARGVIAGASGATTPAHVVRAALDGLVHLTVDVIEAMDVHLPRDRPALRVDGGLTASRYLVQRLADLAGSPVEVATAAESTALGIAGLAGIGAGLIGSGAIAAANPSASRLEPVIAAADQLEERAAWRRFVDASAALEG